MKKTIAISAITALLLTGCSKEQFNQNIGKVGGTTVGAGIGAVIGKQIAGDQGALIGALVGGAIGYLIGDEIDERRANLEKIAQEEKVNISFSDIKSDDGEKIGQSFIIEDKGQFASAKDVLNPKAKKYFEKVAKEFAASKQKVMIVGHTDHKGSYSYNQDLSERRALSIAKIFEEAGVSKDKMYYYGVGELEPIATNETIEGRAKNRRVEIVEAPTEQDLIKYAALQQSNKSLVATEQNTKKQKINKEIGKQAPAPEMPIIARDGEGLNQSTSKSNDGFMDKLSGLFGGSEKSVPNKLSNLSSDQTSNEGTKKGTITYYGNYESKERGQCKNNYWLHDDHKLDFAGVSAGNSNKNELSDSVGEFMVKDSSFSLFTEAKANADSGFYVSCLADSYKEKGEIKSYATGKTVAAKHLADHIPWMQGSVWIADINGIQTIITPIGVFSENVEPSTCPEVAFVKDGKNTPSYATSTKITTYKGKEGFIYRIFPEDTSRFQCADIAFSYQNNEDPKGIIYYKENGKQMKKEFVPKQYITKQEI